MLRRGLLLAVSVSALTGCVSAVSSDVSAERSLSTPSENTNQTAAAKSAAAAPSEQGSAAYRDPMVAAVNSAGQAPENAESAAKATDLSDQVMQPTALNAGQSSIFSARSNNSTATAGDTASPATAPVNAALPGANPARASIYQNNGPSAGDDSSGLPVEDMPVENAQANAATVSGSGGESFVVPDRVPLPTSARTALVAENTGSSPAELVVVTQPAAGAEVAQTLLPAANSQEVDREPADDSHKPMTLAALFAAKRKPGQPDDDQAAVPAKKQPRTVLNRNSAGLRQEASLGSDSLPGVMMSATDIPHADSHSETDDDDVAEEGGDNSFVEIASIAGLARLAPNGLFLQTDRVKTGCFKPELLQVLKTVEKHYGKPIIVTSGLRAAKRNRARQSLHTRCEAADIQIAGVDKWELAEYLRTMPGRGGVGTYCHTESVHIDIGPERDWNWRCRRKK